MTVAIEFDAVTRVYGEQRALDEVSFRVEAGEFLALVGPSGCGKSTTLRIAAGLDVPTSGRVLFDGSDVASVAPSERQVGFVFQQTALYPRSTVEENLRLPLEARGATRSQAKTRARDMARQLGIERLFSRQVETLSGGEQQRVAVGRALVRDPRLLLLDEPLASLDVGWKHQLRELLIDVHAERKMTVIYVTHDPLEVASLASRVVVLESGQVVQAGSLAALAREPKSLFVAQHTTWLPLNVGRVTVSRTNGTWYGDLDGLRVELSGATEKLIEGQELSYSIGPTAIRVGDKSSFVRERTAEIQGVKLARVSAYGHKWWCASDGEWSADLQIEAAEMAFFDVAGHRLDLHARMMGGC